MRRGYDIYIADEVDDLKREVSKLRAERAELVHENALLHERLNRYERRACYGDDLEWTNERRGR